MTYFLLDPHPKIIEKWKEVGYLPDSIRIPKTESLALQMMGTGKILTLVDPVPEDPTNPRKEYLCVQTEMDPQRPIKREITHVYRMRDTDGKEFVFFKQHLSGENFTGDKKVDCTQTVGRYDEPEFTIKKNRETGAKTITGVGEPTTVYEISFNSTGQFKDPSTHETVTMADLQKFLADKIWLYAFTGAGRKYELLNMSFEDFINASYDDLLYYGQHLAWPKKGKKSDE